MAVTGKENTLLLREAREEDLSALLALYAQLNPRDAEPDSAALAAAWRGIAADKNHHVILACTGPQVVASCVLVVVPNLTRGCRPYGLIENVVTHSAHRRRGYARAALNYAEKIATMENCYKLMLMTSSKDAGVFDFYEKAGYNRQDKTAFVRWMGDAVPHEKPAP